MVQKQTLPGFIKACETVGYIIHIEYDCKADMPLIKQDSADIDFEKYNPFMGIIDQIDWRGI